MNEPELHLPFDGLLGPEELRMIAEGLLDDYEWPTWLPQVVHKEPAIG